jgi:predicted DNA repair protein MutK
VIDGARRRGSRRILAAILRTCGAHYDAGPMAAAGLFALLDDIATILDDVAILTKVATSKTAGVLGDDLALNAQQVTGIRADRELPVVWAVAKGRSSTRRSSCPAALLISAVAPWASRRS